MPLSKRDKWILALAPGVIVLAWYAYGSGGKSQTRLTLLRNELAVERARAVDPRMVSLAAAEVTKIQTALDAAKTEMQVLNARVPQPDSATPDRGAPLQFISKTLAAKDLYLVKIERVDNDARGAVSPQLHELWNQLPPQNRPASPQVWRFEMRGTYTHVHEAVEALSKSETFIAPLSISMEPWNENVFKWTVTVWL